MPRKLKMAKPSFTAFLIPKILPALARNKKYSSLLTQQQVELSRRFAKECAKNDFGIALVNLIGKRPAIWLADNIGIKGLPVHYAARKRYIRDKLDSVISELQQVVMIGAGFDTLCLEYSQKYSEIKFFEIDQYATQKIKLDALIKMPGSVAQNMNFVAADLSKQSVSAALVPSGFNKNAKTFFVIEGVLPYLETKDVEKLFADIGFSCDGGSYIVFGSMSELRTKNNLRARFSDATLAVKKEKYKFAAPTKDIQEMLKRAGFKLSETKLYHELQQEIESPEKIKILAGERGEHYYFAIRG